MMTKHLSSIPVFVVDSKQQQSQSMLEEHTAELAALGQKVVREAGEYRGAEQKWATTHSSLYNAVHPAVEPWVNVCVHVCVHVCVCVHVS